MDAQDHLAALLNRLKLTVLRDQLDSLIDEAGRRDLTIREALTLFCEREIARRDQRRIDMSFGISRFPVVRDLTGFGFGAKPSLDKAQIRIAAQSPLGETLFRHYGLRYDVYETVLVITGGRCLMKSEAVLALLGSLGPSWSWLARIGTLVPSPLRNATYDVVATNRYRIWGRTDVCRRPPPGAEARFLG
ncbi:DCC1-like thiol-disulfide oxidoreductase family protein [Methylobacterium brachythecii]|uniref:Putative DCC family thiol-disulfide oxidoreductase YuxK n=1 Tax=Methylobacterium brachythecii TaxID=1176177 RepID=A0A7W6ATD0_9HYPH|nr:DCC1-like thiol-disulfide oxidoreductase family protein [Methylobacterium brachythecii]MBB3905627.1 putative DCC family thiol-disulfide oxidoreductase YuxK [Methylobacterium brachythecii]GLS46886.1 hypothetical protein GCM10007884_48830 [Methylobacterium brachythecii]